MWQFMHIYKIFHFFHTFLKRIQSIMLMVVCSITKFVKLYFYVYYFVFQLDLHKQSINLLLSHENLWFLSSPVSNILMGDRALIKSVCVCVCFWGWFGVNMHNLKVNVPKWVCIDFHILLNLNNSRTKTQSHMI